MIPIPKRKQRSPGHRRAPEQEAEAAKRLGGRTTPGSGSGAVKGDVVSGTVRLECKTTTKKSFRVTREMVDKIDEASQGTEQLPFVEVEFCGGDGEPVSSVAVCPLWVIGLLEERL